MRLLELKLRDVRRFTELTLPLEPGFNLLAGANGAGKTTTIEAIGAALFAAPLVRTAADPSAAIRDGAEELEIEVRFEQDGATYTVRRSRTRAGDDTVTLHDETSGDEVHDDAVRTRVAGLLRLADPEKLPVLFRRLVGIAQGEVTRPFLAAAEDRRRYFEPLLNLDRYELAAERIAAASEPFAADVAAVDDEKAHREDELRGYHAAVSRLSECESEEGHARELLGQVQHRIEELDVRARGLDEARTRLERLTLERAVGGETSRNRTTAAERAHALLDEAEAAALIVQRSRDAHDRWESLEASSRALEIRRLGHDDVRSEIQALEKRLNEGRAAIDEERATLENRLESNQQESERLLGQRDNLRTALDDHRSRSRKAEGLRHALAMAAERAEKLVGPIADLIPKEPDQKAVADEIAARERAARQAEAAAMAAAAEARAAEIEALRARADTFEGARARLREVRESATRLDRVRTEALATLEQIRPAHGACPFFRQPCSNVGGRSLVEHLEHEIEQLDASRETTVETVRYAEARVAEAEAARAELANKETAARATRPDDARKPPPAKKTERKSADGGAGGSLDFDDLAHHLSALAGVLGAIEPPETITREPVALIGARAGEGDSKPAPALTSIQLPDGDEVDQGQRLAHAGRQLLRTPASEDRARQLDNLGGELARVLRQIHASVARADAQARSLVTELRDAARVAEGTLLSSSRELEAQALGRAEIREATKRLSNKDLGLLDTEIALSEKRMKLGGHEREEQHIADRRAEQEKLAKAHQDYQSHSLLAQRVDAYREDWKRLERERVAAETALARVDAELGPARAAFDAKATDDLARDRASTHAELGAAQESLRALARERDMLSARLSDYEGVRAQLAALEDRRAAAERGIAVTDELRELYREMAGPIADTVRQQVAGEANRLYRQVAGRSARLRWDESFALSLLEGAVEREFGELARGEQTTAALAVLLALLKQFPRIGLLFLDEPTEHLDAGRRRALADALAEYRAASRGYVDQLLVVSHDDAFDHVADRRTALTEAAPAPAPA